MEPARTDEARSLVFSWIPSAPRAAAPGELAEASADSSAMSVAFRRKLLSVGAPLGALATGAISGIARCSTKSPPEHFDFLVVGGGSGGIACARRAAVHGKKVMVVERGPDRDEHGIRRGGGYGGTCVNVGCVPKKLMYTAATHFEAAETAPGYGVTMPHPKLDWGALVARRNAYVARLNGIYTRNLDNAGITHVEGFARFVAPRQVEVDGVSYTADHVLIAVGGKPVMPDIPGAEHCISSDGFFDLEAQPEKALVVGAGYIAVELAGRASTAPQAKAVSALPGAVWRALRLQAAGTTVSALLPLTTQGPESMHPQLGCATAVATASPPPVCPAGILHTLGTKVALACRGPGVLRHGFDPLIQEVLNKEIVRSGTELLSNSQVVGVEKGPDGKLQATLSSGKVVGALDCVLMAIGRSPVTEGMGLETTGVKLDQKGRVIVDDKQVRRASPRDANRYPPHPPRPWYCPRVEPFLEPASTVFAASA